MKDIFKRINYPKILDLIFTVFIFLFFQKYIKFEQYNLLILLLFIFIYIFCSKIPYSKDKKIRVDILILTSIFSLFYQMGNIAQLCRYSNTLSLFREFFDLEQLIYFAGVFSLIYKLLSYLYPKLKKLSIKKSSNYLKFLDTKYKCLIAFIIIFLLWLPYFLVCYPGILTPDSIYEMRTLVQNFKFISDAHPVLHTIFMYLPYTLGMKITNDINVSVAFITITQMIIFSGIFAYSISFLSEKKVGNIYRLFLILFYGIVPIFAIYSVCMWKDILFAGFMLLFVIHLWKLLEKQKFNYKDIILFVLISFLVIFFRNNAIYMYVILIPFVIYYFKNNRKWMIGIMLFVIVFYVIIKGPVFEKLGVYKSGTAEYLGVPIQHISRMVYKNVDLTDKQEDLLNELLSVKKIRNNYTPGYADTIKFHRDFNDSALKQNSLDYLKLYISLVLKNPHIALEEEMYLTHRYWYPNKNIEVLGPYVRPNDYGIYSTNLAPKWLTKLTKITLSNDTYLFTLSWSSAIYTWLLIISFLLCIRKKRSLFLYWILFAYIFTLLIGIPIATLRYYLSIYCVLPILWVYPYLKK